MLQAQNVGIGTSTPLPSSLLELNSTNKGLLLPRMNSQQRAGIASPAKGLIVYDNTTSSIWQFNGSSWVEVGQSGGGAATGWLLTGNTGTDPSLHFIGTNDGQPLRFRVGGDNYGKFGLASENNISLGQNSQENINGGVNNVSFGNGTLQLLIAGNGNTAVGHQALRNTTATDNVAVGNQSLNANTTGAKNAALGSYSLRYNTKGNTNTAFGYNAAALNTTGYSNVAIGAAALYVNQAGSNLVAVGDSALYNNTGSGNLNNPAGFYNTAVGSKALLQNTTGNYNTAFGYNALRQNIAGEGNTGIGIGALQATGGNYNTAIGLSALNANTTGAGNTAIGMQSAYLFEQGNDNTFVGSYTGNKRGTNNTAIGTTATVANDISNATALGAGAYAAASNSVVLGNLQAKVGIGLDAAVTKLDVNGEILSRNRITLSGQNGANPASSKTWSMDNYNNDFRIFQQSNISTPGNTVVTVKDGTGNFGVGVLNPSVKLETSGNIKSGAGIYSALSGNFNLVPIGIVRIKGTITKDDLVLANTVEITNVAGNIATGAGSTNTDGRLDFVYNAQALAGYSYWFGVFGDTRSYFVSARGIFDITPFGENKFELNMDNASSSIDVTFDMPIIFYGVKNTVQN
jgi:hypothetical protein